MKIGGNQIALVQVKDEGKKNSIGERIHEWVDVAVAKGWLDFSNGNSSNTNFNTKIQESTHIFLCDYHSFKDVSPGWCWDAISFVNSNNSDVRRPETIDITSENARVLIDGQVYQIQVIDDPMGMHRHLEIYLKFIGGQNE